MNRTIRQVAWGIILGLAVFGAYAHRYAVSPDGMSYLDLSDAVVNGRPGDLVNLYWSPLYPFLIGVARALSGGAPRTEVMAMHAVNVVCFVGMFAAFEYFLIPVFSLAARVRNAPLRGAWGTAGAYGLFGCIALTMTPLELTTPDFLSNAAIFLALGALLRLRERDFANPRREALVLGAALGLGVLAKAFLVPWSLVCFGVLALAGRRRGVRALGYALGAWAVFVLPWTALLSSRAGRLTFGDAGRLTYAWYVNAQDPPSLGGVPPGARTKESEAILPGVGLTGDAPGSNPMWFDPARWNADVHPRLSVPQQLATLSAMSVALVANVAVLTYLVLLVVVAPPGTRRRAWSSAWVVLVPCIAGIAGYLVVIVTSRYIMAFTLGMILIALATLPVASRVRPGFLLAGVAASVAVQALSPRMAIGFSLVTAVAAAMLAGTLVPTRRHILWMVVVPLALCLSIIMFGPTHPDLVWPAAIGYTVALWVLARASIRRGDPARFARGMYTALAVSIGLIFLGRLALRVSRDQQAFVRSASATWSNPEWKIARDLQSRGIVPGTPVALIGQHYEAYWARTARVKIVANVPGPILHVWANLTPQRKDSLFALFARKGARVAILTRDVANGAPDSTWTVLTYRGWMRPLPPPPAASR